MELQFQICYNWQKISVYLQANYFILSQKMININLSLIWVFYKGANRKHSLVNSKGVRRGIRYNIITAFYGPIRFLKFLTFAPQKTKTYQIPYFRKQFPPLNNFRSIYYIKVKLLQKLYENIYIFQPQKSIVSAETIRGNKVIDEFTSENYL